MMMADMCVTEWKHIILFIEFIKLWNTELEILIWISLPYSVMEIHYKLMGSKCLLKQFKQKHRQITK